ncbi:MAG: hypothetical protein IJ071_04925 [Ruminococcus sp.]|nr:hypothetical protein [Ruminococcus sp.]
MKKLREKAAGAAGITLVFGGTAFCIAGSGAVRSAVSEAVGRCLGILIPSLYAMLIMSALLIRSGALRRLSGILRLPGRILLGADGEVLGIFLVSSLAGYPVGGRLLAGLVREGRLSPSSASWLSGACFGAGPAFIFGCIASQLYGDPAAGRLILISSLAADLIIGVGLSFIIRRAPREAAKRAPIRLDTELVSECIVSAGRSMAEICCAVLAFSVVTAALSSVGALSAAGELLGRLSGRPAAVCESLCAAFLDVTAVTKLPAGDPTLLPALSALTAFGGVCVFVQISAAVRGEFPLWRTVLLRILAGGLSYLICRGLLPEDMIMGASVSAAALRTAATGAASPVPSVLLIVMTVTVLREREGLRGRHLTFLDK